MEAIPLTLLKEPLEFLFAEHFRQRQMCKALERLATAEAFDGPLITAVDEFLNNDLALHVIDEEEDLFPLLRRRCEPEDAIEDILGRLSVEHALDRDLAQSVRKVLATALRANVAPRTLPGGAETLMKLARQEKSHMALENAVVMLLARRRLVQADLCALGIRLAARRGIILE